MDQNMMALLTAILSGQGGALGGQQRPSASMATPTAPQPQAKPMSTTLQSAMMQPQMAIGVRPGEHGNDVRPGPYVNPGVDNGNGGKNNGGNGDGKGGSAGNNERLSHFEKQMRRIGNKGPRAYTKTIEKNLGFKDVTPGYGGTDPSSMKTGMASALTGIQPQPPSDDGLGLPTWLNY